MPNTRLLAVVTAFLITGGGSGAIAAVTMSQLLEVERLIVSKDCGALLFYLSENGGLLEGDDPLAQELRSFSQGVEGGVIDCLSQAPGQTGISPEISSQY